MGKKTRKDGAKPNKKKLFNYQPIFFEQCFINSFATKIFNYQKITRACLYSFVSMNSREQRTLRLLIMKFQISYLNMYVTKKGDGVRSLGWTCCLYK